MLRTFSTYLEQESGFNDVMPACYLVCFLKSLFVKWRRSYVSGGREACYLGIVIQEIIGVAVSFCSQRHRDKAFQQCRLLPRPCEPDQQKVRRDVCFLGSGGARRQEFTPYQALAGCWVWTRLYKQTSRFWVHVPPKWVPPTNFVSGTMYGVHHLNTKRSAHRISICSCGWVNLQLRQMTHPAKGMEPFFLTEMETVLWDAAVSWKGIHETFGLWSNFHSV